MMAEYDNWSGPEHVGWHHSQAGDTERAASRANRASRSTHKARLLAHYRSVGELGSTDPESQAALGLSLPGDAGARRHDLMKDGVLVVDSGHRRVSPRGKKCIAWMLA